ncbi:tape measure protein [Corynebacterium sp. USCH3]|uniref:tape measure protein n=1 Tax=Corynebacterium sp. USCH3 TaxID=3024840 RepID=UPI0030979973
MSSDLGHLFATLDIKDEQFKQKIAAAKTDLVDLKKAADDASKVKLDIKPSGTGELDGAKKKTDELNEAQKKADGQKVDVAPTGKADVDAASKAARELEAAEKGADKAKVDVKPTGTGDLDKAADSADGLGKKLDEAGSKAPDVTPTGAGQLDDASSSASDLGKNLDAVEGPDVTPTGTGDVTTAAREAGELDTNLQKAGQSGKSLSVSAQPAQELDKASNSAGKLVDKLGEVAVKTAGKAIKWGAITAGTAAIGGMGVALTKGFQRLDSIDQANAKLQGLGHSAQDIEAIMGSAMDAVKGTAYGFGDAASLAAQMVASGIEPGEELTGVLTTVADTAAIAGRDLNDMGLIFGSVAAKGKLQGDDLLQLMAGGIPVLQMLAEETGKTTEEVSKMASDGEISFEIFESAMKNSLGGAAQDAGNTFKGSMDNAGAAVGRLGAELLKPAFEAAPGVIGSITSKIDELTESAGPVGEKLAAGLSDFAQGAIPQVQGALTTLKSTGEAVWPVLQKIGDVATSIPMGAYVGLLGMAVAKHKGLTGVLSKGGGAMRGFGKEVSATQSQLILQGRNIGTVSTAMQVLGQRVPTIGRMGEAYRKAGDGMRVAGMMSRDAGREMGGIVGVGKRVQGGMQSLGGTLSGTVASGFSLAKSGASGLLSALGGPWGLAIGAATTAIFGLISKHQEAAAAAAEHKAMQDELRDSLDSTTGSITKQTEELQLSSLEKRHEGSKANATKMGISESTLTQALTGDDRARAAVGRAGDAYIANEVTGSDFWNEYGERLQGQGISETDMAAAIREMDNQEYDGENWSAFTDAMSELGVSSAQRSGYGGALKDLRDDASEATEAVNNLKEGIGDGNHNLEQMQGLARDNALQEFAIDAGQASDALSLLSDHAMEMGDSPAEVKVEMDAAEFDEVKGKLDEIGIAYDFSEEDGILTLEMPSGAGVLEMLQQVKGEVAHFEDGRIDIKSTAPEVQQELVDLGIAVEKFDDEGNRIGIHIEDDIQKTLTDLHDLEAFEIDPKTGEITISDNIDVVTGRLDDIDGESLSADLMVSDNSDAVVHNLGVVDVEARTLSDGRVEITDTSDENIQRLSDLNIKTTTLDDGSVFVTDNADAVRAKIMLLNNLRTSSAHTVIAAWGGDPSAQRQAAGMSMGQALAAGNDISQARQRANGGRIPRNAQGSRLPRSAGGDRHSGYRLPTSGPGTGVTDGILGMNPQGIPVSWVDAGEWIINGDSSEAWDGTLAAINGGRPSQIVAAMLADLEAHANGGRTSDRVKSELSPYNGTPYVFGGWGPGGTDCSGAVSMGVNSYLGRDPLESRTGTGNMAGWLAERGFQQGRGGPGDVVVGWYNGGPGGGHTAMVLPDGTFIESGGNTGGGLTIGGAAGPLDGRGFTDFAFLPGDGGEAEDGYDEMGSYSAYSSTAGGRSGGVGSSVSKSVNGGAGPLLKDGSVLEAAAAAYSLQTGQPMPDDVVSWGNVLGLGTTFEGENLETEQRRHEREMRAHDRNIASTERDLAQAKKDIGEKEKALAEAKPEDKQQAQWELDDARDKVADLSDKLIDMRDETVELRKTNEQLKVAVEKQKAAPQSAGQAFGITAMADGGILGAARDAQINEGSATLWAEAGPEAYIPLSRNKRPRSLDLWAETGKRLGVDVLSMANLIGSGLPGLLEGRLQFSSGDTTSLDRMGLNMDAAKHAGGREIGSAIGAVFNGPVTLNDTRGYLQGQLNTASRQINKAMKSRML